MMHVGLDIIRHTAAPDQTAAVLCRIMLYGLAARPPSDRELDGSPAFAAAEAAITTWSDESESDADDKAAHVRAVARAEFGRKGYEVTTIRDIASAAGLGTGTVYRLIGSKDELLASIMESFGKKAGGGFASVLRTDATPVEKLDALSWVNINALDQFPDEWKIQLAWMRQSPPQHAQPWVGVHDATTTTQSVAVGRDPVGRHPHRGFTLAVDAGALRDGHYLGAGEHRADSRQASGAGQRPRHRAARRRGPRQTQVMSYDASTAS